MQVSRRIEKVRAQEAAPEFMREALRDLMERNAAGIGGEDGILQRKGLHLLPQRAFDVQILRDGFENPIAFGNSRKVLVETARCHQRSGGIHEKRRLASVPRRFESLYGRRPR